MAYAFAFPIPVLAGSGSAIYTRAMLGVVKYEPSLDICRFEDLGPGSLGFNLRTERAFRESPPGTSSKPATISEVAPGLANALATVCESEKQQYLASQVFERRERHVEMLSIALETLAPSTLDWSASLEFNEATIPFSHLVMDAPILPYQVPVDTVELKQGAETTTNLPPLSVSLPSKEPTLPARSEHDDPVFRDGISAALENATSLEAAALRLEAARRAVVTRTLEEEAASIRLTNETGLEDSPNGAPYLRFNSTSAVSMVLPIFDGGRAVARTAIQRHDVTRRELDLVEIRSRVAASARAIYWSLHPATIERNLLTPWVAPAEEWGARARILLNERLLTKRDVLAFEAALLDLNARLKVLEFEAQTLGEAWTALTDLAAPSWSADKTTWLAPEQWNGVKDVDRLVEELPSMLRVKADIGEAHDRLEESKLALAGTLDFRGRAEQGGYSESEVFVGLRYVKPIFDSGVSNSRRRELTILLAAARADEATIREGIQTEIRRLEAELLAAELEFSGTKARLSATRRAIDDNIKLFEELPDRLSGLTNAFRGHLTAISRAGAAQRRYHAAYNALLEQLGSLDTRVPS